MSDRTPENRRGRLPRAHVPPHHFLSARPGLTGRVPLRSPLSLLFPPRTACPPSRTHQRLPALASAWPGLSPTCSPPPVLCPVPLVPPLGTHPILGHRQGPDMVCPLGSYSRGRAWLREHSRLMEREGAWRVSITGLRSRPLEPASCSGKQRGFSWESQSHPASSFPGSVAQCLPPSLPNNHLPRKSPSFRLPSPPHGQ